MTFLQSNFTAAVLLLWALAASAGWAYSVSQVHARDTHIEEMHMQMLGTTATPKASMPGMGH